MNARHIGRRSRLLLAVAAAGASALILAGCTAGGTTGAGSEPSSSSGADASTDAGPREDLTLKLGALLPKTGSLAFLGPPMYAGFGLAVKEVNDAKAGITLDVTEADEGDLDTKAYETGISTLRSAGVTAMVGAASSSVSKLILDGNVSAGIMQISPSNTSPDFTTIKDDGLYFRTAPSDLLQGATLAGVIAGDNKKSLGIIYMNDPYGTGLNDAIATAFAETGGEVVEQQSFNQGDGQFSAQVAAIAAAKPDAVAVVSYDQFITIAPLLINAGIPASSLYLVDGNLADYSKTLAGTKLEGAQGTKAGPKLEDDFTARMQEYWTGAGNDTVADFTYAAEAYDAVVLASLAALAANSVEGKAMAAKMEEVSGGSGNGTPCTSFADCAKIIVDGGVADYNGYSGDVTFDGNGDPQGAAIGVYKIGADNKPARTD